MATVRQKRYIGEPVFCVTSEGRVARTIVSRLGLTKRPKARGKGFSAELERLQPVRPYSLLNCMDAGFFSLDAAIAKAKEVLAKRIEGPHTTKAEAEAARAYLLSLSTDAGRQKILGQSLVECSELITMGGDRILGKKETFPTEYFRPGERVYCIITPDTHYSSSPGWRPHPYFILGEMVREVRYAPNWPSKVYYGFVQTNYNIRHEHMCATEEAARAKMVKIFAKETGGSIKPGNIQVVGSNDERKARDKSHKVIVESVLSDRRFAL